MDVYSSIIGNFGAVGLEHWDHWDTLDSMLLLNSLSINSIEWNGNPWHQIVICFESCIIFVTGHENNLARALFSGSVVPNPAVAPSRTSGSGGGGGGAPSKTTWTDALKGGLRRFQRGSKSLIRRHHRIIIILDLSFYYYN
jgi:hypothetical protein